VGVFAFGDEPMAATDGCDEPPGALVFEAAASGGFVADAVEALVFGAADSVGFGADVVEAPFIGGELLGALGVEDVVLASFEADALVAG
jgi:hypothetical protein